MLETLKSNFKAEVLKLPVERRGKYFQALSMALSSDAMYRDSGLITLALLNDRAENEDLSVALVELHNHITALINH